MAQIPTPASPSSPRPWASAEAGPSQPPLQPASAAHTDADYLSPTTPRREPKPHPLAAFGIDKSVRQSLLPSPPPSRPTSPTDAHEPAPHTTRHRSGTEATAVGSSFLPDLDDAEARYKSVRRGAAALSGTDGTESPAEDEVIAIDNVDASHELEAGYAGYDFTPRSARQSRISRSVVGADDHPLSEFDMAKRRSMHPWEFVDPPPANGPIGTLTSADTRGFTTLREKPSRSLVPKSSYYFGPPPPGSAFGSDPVGQIGVHYPREIIRVERDYSGGELIQFATTYPLELEGRITPTQFLETMNSLNEILIDAHSLRHAFFDNCLEIFSLQLSRLFLSTHYDKQMRRLRERVDQINTELFNPNGLSILWPRKVAFMFLEIEYY